MPKNGCFKHFFIGENNGEKNKKAPREALVCLLTGGEGGIRTHGSVATTPDFESGTFDHSATSPAFVSKPAILAGNSRRQHRNAAHVRAQHFGYHHAAIGLLVVFQHRHQGAAHGQARTVQGVQQLVRDDG